MPITGNIPPIPHIEGCVQDGKLSPAFWAWVTGVDKYLRGVSEFGEAEYLTEVTPQDLADTFGVAVLQSNFWSSTATTTNTTDVTPYDNTIPQVTEGVELWSESITPKSDNSDIVVHSLFSFSTLGAVTGTVHLHTSNQTDALDVREIVAGSAQVKTMLTKIPSWGKTARTISIRAGLSSTGGGASLIVNANSLFNGTRHSVVFWEEREATPIS